MLRRSDIIRYLQSSLHIAYITGEVEHQSEFEDAIKALTTGKGKRRDAKTVLREYIAERESVARLPETFEALQEMRRLCR